MRLNVFIAVACCTLATNAAVRFTEPVWRPDLGIALSGLVRAKAAPIRLPKAETYLVTASDGKRRIEDRFDVFDMWVSITLRGRWQDAEGNELQIARLSTRPPDVAPGTVSTRREFYDKMAQRAIDPKRQDLRDEAVYAIAPVDVQKPVRPRRSKRKNLLDLVYYSTTNDNVLVCAFRPRSPESKETTDWYLATLLTVPGSDSGEVQAWFDAAFLDEISIPSLRTRPEPVRDVLPSSDATEAELLIRDIRNNVVNYDEWHCASAEDVLVVDDLDASVRGQFVATLTNNLPRLRREYARCAPTALDATNQTAVVRVFQSREEYLSYVGVEQKWTAALWSPVHRELVLYHPEKGTEKLLRTVWHEAFHQYLAYAGSMVSSSPWFNEGHAELFEYSHFDSKGSIVFERDIESAAYVQEFAAELALNIPAVLEMNYDEFYAGDQYEIEAKYRLAWSIAYFLEVGAPKLRYRPYEKLRGNYVDALVRTRSMYEATAAVFDDQTRERFIAAWLAFWKRQ